MVQGPQQQKNALQQFQRSRALETYLRKATVDQQCYGETMP